MSVFNQFQRELQKIGSRPNQQQIISPDDVKLEVEDDQSEEADPDEGQKSEESEDDEQEQSVVYSTGGNVFDQPHRAVYGIKKAK
jgi:hypothetical protein